MDGTASSCSTAATGDPTAAGSWLAFEARKQEFADLGVSIVAASIDPIEKAQ